MFSVERGRASAPVASGPCVTPFAGQARCASRSRRAPAERSKKTRAESPMPKTNPSREDRLHLCAGGRLGRGSLRLHLLQHQAADGSGARRAGSAPCEPWERDTRPDDARRRGRLRAAPGGHALRRCVPDGQCLSSNDAARRVSRCLCGVPFSIHGGERVRRANTRRQRAGARRAGSLSGSGVLVTRSGTVEVTFYFVDDPGGVAIVNMTVAGAPALPMGNVPMATPDAGAAAKKR